ncbi:glycoside hydrolase family 13 protein [Polychaeton citri CBS 116435]|uniref:Glycoside hydrolase family 13 protein n=1 Tax=Polychaeton citri CBS 116435 TaxID=1314669 RepID=A0A9P4UK71_9PEZI|nr:glycoside hydrolase family 13 protein [Polychaeton citri CBS 116435]
MSDSNPTPENATLLQGFEWYAPADGKHYQRLLKELPRLKACGVDNVWVPPGCKASSSEGNGYDIYDLYDLGEFDQKGSVRTKWGTKQDLHDLSQKAKELGMGLYWDAVLNHKAGADKKEKVQAVEVDENDRNRTVSDSYEIEAWLGFDFPGRGDKYSTQKYHWYHFSGTDYNAANEKKAIYKLQGENKGWSETVDDEQGNADYMMFADVDYSHPEVQEDVKKWGVWITKELGLKGFRLDAVQHFSERFTNEWVEYVRKECGDIFMVGEFWVGDADTMIKWLDKMDHKFALFDAPLLYNFARLSTTEDADLRTIFDKTLVKAEPVNAVTCLRNHDTQKGQVMETKIEGFFQPLGYALILLQDAGYPCLFYGDLYGTKGDDPEPPVCGGKLADMTLARKLYAYGQQDEYLDNSNCIGFVRRGTHDRKDGLACVMSNTGPGSIRMAVGDEHKGEIWTDLLGWEQGEVIIDDEGYGEFKCPGISVAIWVNQEAEGRDRFPVNFDSDIYGR